MDAKRKGGADMVDPIKTTVRMPDALHKRVKSRAAEQGVTIEKITNNLLQLWIRKGPGRVHIDIRPDGDIILMTPSEVEEELQKMKRPAPTMKKPSSLQ